jgi:hypothetical protein
MIARYHGPSMKNMLVHFTDKAFPKALPLLRQFSALQGLVIRVDNSTNDLAASDYKLQLPNLCSLELHLGSAAMPTLNWFARCSLPKLTTFVLVIKGRHMMDTTALLTFMQTHGTDLNSVRLDTNVPRLTAAVLPHTAFVHTADRPSRPQHSYPTLLA